MRRGVVRPNTYEDQDRGLSSASIFWWYSFLLRVYHVSGESLPLHAVQLQQDATFFSVAVLEGMLSRPVSQQVPWL